ncbi:XylR family transcriptional regulator [Aeoliella mucimassa]|uniref:Xylose operon regulatory protein n=1 Tax=Aeoliella mucimassa TaxID=2527972 RepID=A0A518AQF3_9BACT|nr:DNA-binding transcriptional regulator [Aeoliella mucimassa]QDU56951.1 Xylose operon regulatory protein [Aeoliella mucimassa]
MVPKVAILVESTRGYGRNLLRGIAAYTRSHGAFSIYRQDCGLGDAIPAWLRDWKGDGIIARIETEELAEFLANHELPIVDLRYRFSLSGVPRIETNELSVAQQACDHLIHCGVRNFAFCGFNGADYSRVRQELAVEYLSQRGYKASVHNSEATSFTDTANIESSGFAHDPQLCKWLKELPKPVGLFACNDVRAAQVLNVCRELGIHIPREIAVLGVDDDRLICELTTPPLSSVALDTFRIGYLAAETLSRMMRGLAPHESRMLVSAKGISRRQSTDLLQVDDPDVAVALQFIREHACDGITVDDVAKACHQSRSTLVRRFSKHTRTTVKGEIKRVRVNRIKQLLADTDYSLTEIAGLVGFAHVEYMSTMFKKHSGETPAQYRKMYQTIRTVHD